MKSTRWREKPFKAQSKRLEEIRPGRDCPESGRFQHSVLPALPAGPGTTVRQSGKTEHQFDLPFPSPHGLGNFRHRLSLFHQIENFFDVGPGFRTGGAGWT